MMKVTKPAAKPYKPGAMFEKAKAMKKNKNWIAGAIKHPGALRASLGVKEGKNIPPKKLAAAAKKGGKTGKRARLAQTLKSFHKTQKQYEGSKLDNKLDRITGFKEGSKKDEAMDKAIAPHVKSKKGKKKMYKKEPEKGETKKHERGESKAFEAKEKDKKRTMKKTKKKSIPQLYQDAGKGLENVGANIRQNIQRGQSDPRSTRADFSINPLQGSRSAFMKAFQKKRSAKKK